jgi:hypothetical protein
MINRGRSDKLPVPERAFRNRQRSGWHHHLHGVRAVAGIAIGIRRCLAGKVGRPRRPLDDLLVPQVASRNDFGASVQFSRIVNRPERADAKGRARPGHLGAAVVKMPGLHGFAGMQVDRKKGRQQAALSQLRFGKSQCQRMNRKVCE